MKFWFRKISALILNNAVNELSNTMDLPSTLLRAQSLFRRFQRTVEAIDKRNNFPAPPGLRQRKPGPPSRSNTAGSGSGTPSSPTAATGNDANRGHKWNYNAPPSSIGEGTASISSPPPPSSPPPTSPPKPDKPTSDTTSTSTEQAKKRASKAAEPKTSASPTESSGAAGEVPKEKIVSRELRMLLSRKWNKLDKKSVEKHGGGVGS